jgi:TPR repeat protein
MRKLLFVVLMALPIISGCQKPSSNIETRQSAPAQTETNEAESNFKQGVDLLQQGDYDNALKYIRFAAEKGHQFAQFKLGAFYENGTAGKMDLAEAVKWYRLAATQGHPMAQFKLGTLYRYGFGVKIDFEQAKKWYGMAAQNGNQDAVAALSELETESLGGTLSFLNAYADKYPYEVKLLDHPLLSKRVEALIGDRFKYMKKTWAVETPMKVSNGKFIASACMAHNCASTNFIIIYDFAINNFYVGIREDDVVSTYSENRLICDELQSWAANNL